MTRITTQSGAVIADQRGQVDSRSKLEVLKKYFEDGYRPDLANGLREAGVKAVAFDMDGTLVDTEDYCIQNLVKVVNAELNIELTPEEIARIPIGQRSLPICKVLLEPRGFSEKVIEETAKKITPSFQAGLAKEIDEGRIRAFPKVIELVKDLYRANFPLAIVTSNTKAIVEKQIEKNNLRGHFKFIISKEDADAKGKGFSKPNPYVYDLASQKFGLNASEILVFEDSNSGLTAGRDAGAQLIGIRNKASQQPIDKEHLENPELGYLDMVI